MSQDGIGSWEQIESALQRISAQEKRVHALLPDESDAARKKRLSAEFEEICARWPDPEQRPPLFGALVGVKDLFHTEGFPTRGGSSLPAEAFCTSGAPGRPAPAKEGAAATDAAGGCGQAEAVARLRAAGALILGKTVSTEFAYFAPGSTANPLNTAHTPGGSSSGSAAAVAAGYCNLALGTQTIGSITRPASFCGVVGYKPSYGRIPTDGIIPFSPAADHAGLVGAEVALVTRGASVLTDQWETTVADTAHAAAVISDARRAKSPEQGISAVPPGLRELIHTQIGTVLIPDDAYLQQASAEARAALDGAAERLAGLGVAVHRVSIMEDIEDINTRHRQMIAREFAEVHHFWFDEFGDRYHQRSRELLETGRNVDQEHYERALRGRTELRERLDAALQRHGASVWLAPATVGAAPKGLDTTGDPVMNLPWTHAGVPVLNLPLRHVPHGTSITGLPLGVQIATFFGSDEMLLYRSALLEAAFQ